jgi:nucleotidyltransferase/DNA polymerase involved in DNA repair
MGVQTIGDLTRLPEAALATVFGKNGVEFARHARGLDERPVVVEHEVKSISQEITYERDVADLQRLKETLKDLSAQVAFRLRQSECCAGTIRLKLRWADFSTISRQVTLSQAADQDSVIYTAVERLCESVWQAGRKVRLIGVGAGNLSTQPQQPGLWDTSSDKERRLLEVVDGLREKFGSRAILPGRTIGPGTRQKKAD